MKKRQRNAIALVVALALLAGVYLYITNRPKAEPEDDSDEQIEISKFDKDSIVKMVLESAEGTLTLEKADDKWTVDYSRPVELKETAVDDIAYSFSSLYAERMIDENPEDLSVYGLDKPAVKATAYLKDGTVRVLYLGNKTPAGNTYYLMAEGDPKVYTVWMNHGEHFQYKLADIMEKKLTEIDTIELTYLKIEGKNIRTIEIESRPDQTEEEAQFNIGIWKMVQPYSNPRSVSTDKFEKVLDAISALSIEDIIEDDPADLSKYGLDDPAFELIVKDKENTLHLYFGDETEDGEDVYFKTANDNIVYTMRKNKTKFLETKPFEIVEKFAYIVNIDDVDKIIVEGRGKTHVITLTRETKKAEKEDEEDEVITTYKVDGEEVEEKPFKKYYQSLIGLLADAENDRQLEEQPEVKTTFFLNKGSVREVHVNYTPYDNDFYAVFVDGKSEFVISRQQVYSMLDDLEALIRGDLVKEE
ncbi:MAG: DUF4340 domain-containing protein [Caldicoprobacteraceae bacterium]